MAEIDRGMEVGDLRKLLTKSKAEPVNAAVGIDGKNGVFMLDKIKAGKILSKQLELKFKGLKSPRWGTALVNVDEDPKLVILTLNKGGGGLGQKLKKSLKGTGFTKVRIQLEDGTVDEDIGEEDEEVEGQSADGAAPQAAAWDPAELTATLAGLVKKMMGLVKSAPERLDELKTLATTAQTAIKGGVEAAAKTAVDAFATALGSLEQAAGAATNGAAPNASLLSKSGLAWVSTRKRVEDELGKLEQAMLKHYDGQAFSGELKKLFDAKVAPILTNLDQTLAAKLDEAGKSADGAEQQKLLGEARQIIGKYESFVAGNSLISQLDANPFVPLQVEKTLTATLGALKKSVG